MYVILQFFCLFPKIKLFFVFVCVFLLVKTKPVHMMSYVSSPIQP